MSVLKDLLVLRQAVRLLFWYTGKYLDGYAVPLFQDTVFHLHPSAVLHLIGQCETVSVCQYLTDVLNTAHHLAPLGILGFEHGVAVDPVEVRIAVLSDRIELRRSLGLLYFDDRIFFKIDQIHAAVIVKKRLEKFISVFIDHSLSFAL